MLLAIDYDRQDELNTSILAELADCVENSDTGYVIPAVNFLVNRISVLCEAVERREKEIMELFNNLVNTINKLTDAEAKIQRLEYELNHVMSRLDDKERF